MFHAHEWVRWMSNALSGLNLPHTTLALWASKLVELGYQSLDDFMFSSREIQTNWRDIGVPTGALLNRLVKEVIKAQQVNVSDADADVDASAGKCKRQKTGKEEVCMFAVDIFLVRTTHFTFIYFFIYFFILYLCSLTLSPLVIEALKRRSFP